MPLIKLKLRTDTRQLYENIVVRDSRVNHQDATLIQINPWKQYSDSKVFPLPKSVVRNIKVSGITGKCSTLGGISGNRGQSDLSDITLENINLTVKSDKFRGSVISDSRMSS
jgi:hypothetical protein